ncbi:hypothetical protein D3C75_877970 [compost metagenome]
MSFNFDQVVALKKGEVIWECSQYGSLKIELLEDPVVTELHYNENVDNTGVFPVKTENKVEFKAKVVDSDRVINYLLNSKYMHYGPKLYRENAYMSRAEMDAWRAEAAAAYAAELAQEEKNED